MKPALVILAAGASERLGQPKALVEIGGKLALEWLVEAGAWLDDAPALVIVGAHTAAIRARAPKSCEILDNPAWKRGRTGGAALAARARAGRDLCLAPIDVPLVPSTVFRALEEAWRAACAPPRGWLAPRCAGRFGHPIVIGRELAREIEFLEEDSSLRALRALAEPLLAVAVESAATLDDLDTPEDLARLRARFPPG